MKTLSRAEATIKSPLSETEQTMNGLNGSALGERDIVRPAFAGGSWGVQSGRSIVLRNDDSVLMKSQLG